MISIIQEFDLKNEIKVEIRTFTQKISHELTMDEILNLALYIQELIDLNSCDGIVVTMGTNALEDVSFFINLVINTKKAIVFTGAHFPQGSLNFDGRKNLYNALLLASADNAIGLGVLVTFNDYVVTARDATKSTPGIINGFSIDGNGVVGYMVGDKFYLKTIPNHRHTFKSEFVISKISNFPPISVIYAHLGMDNSYIRFSISSGIRGIISAGYGKGYQSKVISQALHEAVLQGVVVVRCARTGRGYTNIDEKYDEQNGFIVANDLSPHKCSILLAIALSITSDKGKIQKIFQEY